MVENNDDKKQDKQRCPDCTSTYGYMRVGKIWVCRQCGEITQLGDKDK
jgi:ribosomal protein L37AE/L43A